MVVNKVRTTSSTGTSGKPAPTSTLLTNIEGEWQQQHWEEQLDRWQLRLQQLLSVSRSASARDSSTTTGFADTTQTTSFAGTAQTTVLQAQLRQQFCWRNSDTTIQDQNWQSTTERIQRQLGEQHGGKSTSTLWLATTSLSPSEVRNIVAIAECNVINSEEKCFHNNVFIDNLVGDIEIHNHNLRLSMSLNKRDAPSHRLRQQWAP